jgi:ribulose-phosphate 3-epimerase
MISVSILNIKDDNSKIELIDSLGSDYIHIDIMDGEFVTNTSEMVNLPSLNTKRDIHLMVYDIKSYVDIYKKYNPEYITFHVEATNDIREMIDYIHSLGIKVGLSIKPGSSIDKIYPYLGIIDLALVMSVEPGAGGQKFIPTSEDKINELKDIREKYNYHYMIEVDGGVNIETKDSCKNADILVVGSYITMSDNPKERYLSMK